MYRPTFDDRLSPKYTFWNYLQWIIVPGPHCFVVRMRDESGEVASGITIHDMGYKEGEG